MSHQVGVDPVDDARIDISDLEQRWNLRVAGSTLTQITSAIRQSLPSSIITVIPARTWMKTGSFLVVAPSLAWSTDISCAQVQPY